MPANERQSLNQAIDIPLDISNDGSCPLRVLAVAVHYNTSSNKGHEKRLMNRTLK